MVCGCTLSVEATSLADPASTNNKPVSYEWDSCTPLSDRAGRPPSATKFWIQNVHMADARPGALRLGPAGPNAFGLLSEVT